MTIVNYPPLNVIFPSFILTDCKNPIAYTAKYNGGTLPTFITLDPTNRKLTISPSSNSDKGTYTLTIIGTINTSYGKTYTASTTLSLLV